MQEASQAIATGRLGRYELLGELGRGAMGVVFRARDPIIDRVVALKTIDPGCSGAAHASFAERFFQEARSAGRLNHPNIVTIYDAGEAGGQAYIAMEYLEGTSLRQTLDEQALLPVQRAVEIAGQVARGLAYAHEHGVVHRDIKPANIIVLRNRRPKITDFGIARLGEADVLAGSRAGSPKYMSPEQIRGDGALDGRSDLFSLGAVLYEMLTGRQPFAGVEVVDIMRAVLESAPAPPSAHNAAVPPELDAIVLRMLAKRPDERYPSARWLYREFRQLEERLEKTPAAPAPRAETRKVSLDDPTLVIDTPDPVPAKGPVRAKYMDRRIAAGAALAALAIVGGVVLATRDASPPPVAAVPAAVVAAAPPVEAAPAPLPVLPAVVIEKPPEPAPHPKAPPRAAKNPAPPPPAPVAEPTPPPVPVVDVDPLPRPAPPPPQTGRLILAVSPWGEVYVDGKRRGTTPPLAEVELPPGRHRIEIRNSAQLPYHTFVELQAGETQPIRHIFAN